jgi:hypothetical protein
MGDAQKEIGMKKLITCLVVCVLSGAAFATTWSVDDEGKADFDNIQATIDADEPRGGVREIMPCDLARVTDSRGVMYGTLWPAGLVYYDFDASISQLNRDRTRAAMDFLEAATEMGTVFIPRTNEPDYIHIIEAGGNWSSVGMQGGSQDLSMYNWSYQFIICHELIHALGRLHQQSRSDRDSYITVNWECIDTNYAYNYNMCEQCPNYGEYDFESVMHYSQWGFNIGCPTMTCLPGYEEYQDVMGQRDYLSDGDIETLQFMYPSSTGACCSETGTCLEAYEYQCENVGWNWQGLGTLCVDGCFQNALGACCVGTSICVDILQSNCNAGGGTWLGPNTVCADGECKSPSCEADIDGNGSVDVGDLLDVVDAWGLTDSPADLNQDGIVNVSDLLIVVGNWGECE